MSDTAEKGVWARRVTLAALVLSVGGLTAALIAALGTALDAWHFRTGFVILRYALYAAIAGGLAAIAGLILARRGGGAGLRARNILALAVAIGFVGYLGPQIRTARTVPAIHDISTNLSDLPQFETLKVRADNLEKVPDTGRPELAALSPEERWKAIHREAYADIRPVRVPWPVEQTIQKAEALARKRGWEVARSDPAAGALEATDTTLFFRFKDDVAIRARAAPGGGSIVDMRSISRVGGSDVGVNAKRVKRFLSDLQAS